MEMFYFVAGIVISWVIQHFYSLRSSAEQIALFKKLSAETRDMILADPREALSVAELNEIIDRRTIDPEADKAHVPLPYIACPKCGSKDITRRESFDAEHDEVYYIVHCNACSWGDWSQ